MKKVTILAYSVSNLGDDLFVKILCNRYPHVQFTLLSSRKYGYAFASIPNLNVVFSIPKVDGIFRRLKLRFTMQNLMTKRLCQQADAVVSIGGSIFMQGRNWQAQADDFLEYCNSSSKFYILGSNFGPYKDEIFKRTYSSIFNLVEDVCFRDQYSYKIFSDHENVRYAPDIVFTHKHKLKQCDSKTIIISLIDLSNREQLEKYAKEYYAKMAAITKGLIDRGYHVCLFSFCTFEGDMRAIDHVLSSVGESYRDQLSIYEYAGNLEEAIEVLSDSTAIIATRFHAMILGFTMNKVVLPLIYSNKSENVLADIGFTGLFTRIENIEQLDTAKAIEYLQLAKPIEVGTYSDLAEKQFIHLDEFLTN